MKANHNKFFLFFSLALLILFFARGVIAFSNSIKPPATFNSISTNSITSTTSISTTTIPSLIFVHYYQPLDLQNTTTLSSGEQSTFLNGTIKVSSVSTSYSPPSNITNIYSLSTAKWTATTYLNLTSTYSQPLFLGAAFFKALNIDPSNVTAYEWITTEKTANVVVSTQVTPSQITTSNGTVTVYTRNQIIEPEIQIGGYWQLLNNNNTIIAPGNDQFMITGRGRPGYEYNWSFELSTSSAVMPIQISSNLIVGNFTITPQYTSNYSSARLLALPISTINIDPVWIVPAKVTNVINITVNNIDLGNAISINSVLLIPINSLNYTSVLDGGVNNIVVFNGITGNIEHSWLAGNVANEISTTFNTASQVNLYVRIGSSIAVDTNAVNVISIGTYPMSTLGFTFMTGEAPQLTGPPGSTTWGTYDDGANVFYIYDNFSCFSGRCQLNSNTWNTAATYNSANELYEINNGLFITYAGESGTDLGLITLKSIGTSNGIVDALFGNYKYPTPKGVGFRLVQ